jgi:hypothetical protein
MVNIPADVLAHLLSQRIERWVARGRALDAAWDEAGVRRVMRFGKRRRLWAMIPCAGVGAACTAAFVVEIVGIPLGFWTRIAYAFFMFPLFLVSVWHAVGVCFTTVVLSDAEVVVRFGFGGSKTLEWSRVFSVKFSPLRSDFVIEAMDGSCLRIPVQMDGLRTLCDFLITRLPATIIDPSVPIAMAKLI